MDNCLFVKLQFKQIFSGPEKSLAPHEITLQYTEMYKGRRPISPYTMYAGVELLKLKTCIKNFKCIRSTLSRFL